MVKELKEHVLDGRKWYYYQSDVCNIDRTKAEEFDIYSHSAIRGKGKEP